MSLYSPTGGESLRLPRNNHWLPALSCGTIKAIMAANERTHVFMDESGDAGFKVTSGSSPLFCIAAVIFRSYQAMDEVEEIMRNLKAEMHMKKQQEFHFNRESHERRVAFCQAVAGCDFTIRAIMVDKSRVYKDTMLRKSPTYFYNYITGLLLKHSFGSIQDAKVRIDGTMNRDLRTYLRKNLNTEEKIISSVEFADSERTPLIQLADMMAGSIARFYHPSKKWHDICLRILRPRIEDIWDFGR
jgi:hypothetical protein